MTPIGSLLDNIHVDLGCGNNKPEGAVGIDRLATSSADIIHDIDRDGIPLPDNSCRRISSGHFMEHIVKTQFVLEEIWRVGKPGAEVSIRVPYAQSQAGPCDPAHVKNFPEYWMRRCYWFRQHFADLTMTFAYDEVLLEWARKAMPGASDDVLRVLYWNVCKELTATARVCKPAISLTEAGTMIDSETWWAQEATADGTLRP